MSRTVATHETGPATRTGTVCLANDRSLLAAEVGVTAGFSTLPMGIIRFLVSPAEFGRIKDYYDRARNA